MLDEDALIYHYPDTNRPALRDANEIQALKNSLGSLVPVFVVVRPSPSSTVRNLRFGWVENWNNDTQQFLITLNREHPLGQPEAPLNETPFRVTADRRPKKSKQIARPGQARFRFEVFRRYDPKCAACDIRTPELLDAIHIRPFSAQGTDDPRNGLVLCANHHRAFDAGIFTFDPISTSVHHPENRSLDPRQVSPPPTFAI